MATHVTRIACSIPLDASGRHLGHLAVPFSDDAHAYGTIPVPIAVLAGAPGPTVLLTAGVHGDEYEGQIALRRLLTIDAASLTGRLIVLPALNLPAVRAGRRTSPIDGANMNRAFPGSPDGGPTAQLAHYVEHVLLQLAQAAIDLHSGGSASEYLPSAYVYARGKLAAAKEAMADAFGAPLAIMVGDAAETRSLSAACERQNVPMIATELAGSGTLSRNALRLAWEGVTAVLRHLGVMPVHADDAGRHTSRVRIPDRTHVVMSPGGGLFEPMVDLGDTVTAGGQAGWLHDLDDPAQPPRDVRFGVGGLVVIRRTPTLVRYGDFLFTTAIPVEPT